MQEHIMYCWQMWAHAANQLRSSIGPSSCSVPVDLWLWLWLNSPNPNLLILEIQSTVVKKGGFEKR
jgi:hypothetical protein